MGKGHKRFKKNDIRKELYAANTIIRPNKIDEGNDEAQRNMTAAVASSSSSSRPDNGVWAYDSRKDGGQGIDLELAKKDMHLLPFVQFYSNQPTIIYPEELEAFWNTCWEVLPTTFRLLGTGPNERLRQRLLSDEFSSFCPIKNSTTGEVLMKEGPKSFPWYPFGFHVSIDGKSLKKLPVLKPLYELIRDGDALGILSRQEQVSMIPPFLLDVKSHHRVLDMCASPGSKTHQLLESLHLTCPDGTTHPTGYLIANDAVPKRAYLLTSRVRALSSESLLVTCHDAGDFPSRDAIFNLKGLEKIKVRLEGDFDRILADVPCSGDGTSRKNLSVWKGWTPEQATSLSKMQFRIAFRGAQLLSVGGYMVYSTCSLNPVEDEAVVAQLLRASNGNLELVDCSDKLPGLKRRAGVSKWRVGISNPLVPGKPKPLVFFDKYAEYEKFLVDNDIPKKFPSHQKLPITAFSESEEELKKMNIHYCMRLVHHDQDTGGFFVALLKKTGPFMKVSERVKNLLNQSLTSTNSNTMMTNDILQKNDENLENEIEEESTIAIVDSSSSSSFAAAASSSSSSSLTSAVENNNYDESDSDDGGKFKGGNKRRVLEDGTIELISSTTNHSNEVDPSFFSTDFISEEASEAIFTSYGLPEDIKGCFVHRMQVFKEPKANKKANVHNDGEIASSNPSTEVKDLHPRSIYFITPALRPLLLANIASKKLRVVIAGVQAYEKLSDKMLGLLPSFKCNYRLCMCGTQALSTFLHLRKVTVSPEEFKAIILQSISSSSINNNKQQADGEEKPRLKIQDLQIRQEKKDQIALFCPGPMALCVDSTEPMVARRLSIPILLGASQGVNPFVSAPELNALLSLIS